MKKYAVFLPNMFEKNFTAAINTDVRMSIQPGLKIVEFWSALTVLMLFLISIFVLTLLPFYKPGWEALFMSPLRSSTTITTFICYKHFAPKGAKPNRM